LSDRHVLYLLALQADMQAARLAAEAKVVSLTTDLSTAQASCADLNSQLQQSLQAHEASTKSLQEQHQAALDALQAKLSDQEQQLQAAAVKAEEDRGAMAAANQRIQEQDAQIENLKQQMAGEA
jgi:chromosome segregation ATPase